MPQISPINWLVISISFFLILSILLSNETSYSMNTNNNTFNNNILWNW